MIQTAINYNCKRKKCHGQENLYQVCKKTIEAFDNKEDEFGKTVINILESEYGK